MQHQNKRVILLFAVLSVILLPFLLKLAGDYHEAARSSETARQFDATYQLLAQKMNDYVARTGHLPMTLKEIAPSNLPISIDRLRYVNETNRCVISFRNNDGINLYFPYYNQLLQTN